VRLRVEGASLADLLAEAGRALAELLAGPGALGAPLSGPAEEVEVRAPDAPALLVDWLNELVFLSETRKRVYTRFEMEEVSEVSIRARVRGMEPEALRTPVKAATLHEARVETRAEGLCATVVLDV
jgi:SHS2 domain-containing protein